jgi:hypothetical protein
MTLAEFLAWEERQELRYEFDGFRPVAMTGGTLRHEAISGTLRALLHQRLRGSPCRVRTARSRWRVAFAILTHW